MKAFLCTFLGFLAINSLLFSQVAPKYSNEFLAIGVGARSLGMSGSSVASTDDACSGYWNPAGLLKIKSNLQVSLMHAEYFAGIAKYDFGSFATPLDSNTAIGATLIRFGVDDIPNTTELIDADGNIDYNRIRSFSAADYGFLFSIARKSKIKGLNLGGNAKIIHRKVGDFAKSWGLGIDLAFQYELKKWIVGATIRDITTTVNAWRFSLDDKTKQVFILTGNEIPENSLEVTLPKILAGVSRNFDFTPKIGMIAEAGLDITTDKRRNVLIQTNLISGDPHAGLELNYGKVIFLRAGLGNFQEITENNKKIKTFQPNMGVGVKIKGISLDYALTDIGDQSVALYSNIFSLKIDLNRRN